MAGMLGIAAASSANANSVQTGPPKCVATNRPMKPATESVVAGVRMRRWPSRSTRREICGATSALVSANVAATAPASPYAPCVWDSMATMPIVDMATGRRAMKPAAAKPLAPGGLKISL